MTTPDLPVNMRKPGTGGEEPPDAGANRTPDGRTASGACTVATLAGDDDLSGLLDLYPLYCEDE